MCDPPPCQVGQSMFLAVCKIESLVRTSFCLHCSRLCLEMFAVMYSGAKASVGKRNSGFWNPSCEHGLSWSLYLWRGRGAREKSRKEPRMTGSHAEACDGRGARSPVKGSRFPPSAMRTYIIHSPRRMPRVLHQHSFPPLVCVYLFVVTSLPELKSQPLFSGKC